MPNGLPHNTIGYSPGGEIGHSAEEGSIIIPRPNYPNQYYFIFLRTANQLHQDGYIAGAFATLVDMELDGGLGDVVDTFKNVLIIDSTEEKLSATPHANGIDYWLMVRQGGTNNYHAFLITESGISAEPVTTSLGLATSTFSTQQGNLRFNHRGDMFVHNGGNILEIFDFDNNTGALSNLRTINPLGGNGLEFSADDSKLYTGGPIQYDMTVPTQAAIQASEIMLFNVWDPPLAGLQLGLDGKIYGNNFDGNQAYYMGCIHNPNAAGFACNYEDSVIYLQGKEGGISVPQFLPNFFKTNFYADTVCVGDTTRFYMNFTFIDSVFWNFGDPGSGVLNTDTALSPTHVYNTAGSYTVTLIAQNGIKTDTVVNTIEVKEKPQIDLGPDVAFCATPPDSVKLEVGSMPGIYLWSDGSTDSTLWVSTTGVYSVTFTNECGSDSDTIQVEAALPLIVQLPPDTALCTDSYVIMPNIQNESALTQFMWNTGDSTRSLLATRQAPFETSMTYQLTASNACGSDSASIAVTFLAQPDGVLPNDSVYCLDDAFYLLNQQSVGIQYEWNDGTTGPQYRVSESGTYWLKSSSICDTLIDTFKIEFNGEPKVLLPNDTLLCPGEEVLLLNLVQNAPAGQLYAWSTGSTDSSITVFSSETGRYIVTVTLKSCSVLDSTTIGEKGFCPERCTPRIANVFSPNADGVNDVFSVDIDCRMTEVSFFIYNRWGQLVHQSGSLAMVWDGYINGIAAAEGTYYYVLQFTDEAGEQRSFRGSFSLVP